jgi:hypothetical protein
MQIIGFFFICPGELKISKPPSQEMTEVSTVPRHEDTASRRRSPTIFIKRKERRAIRDGSSSKPSDLYSEGARLDSRPDRSVLAKVKCSSAVLPGGCRGSVLNFVMTTSSQIFAS